VKCFVIFILIFFLSFNLYAEDCSIISKIVKDTKKHSRDNFDRINIKDFKVLLKSLKGFELRLVTQLDINKYLKELPIVNAKYILAQRKLVQKKDFEKSAISREYNALIALCGDIDLTIDLSGLGIVVIQSGLRQRDKVEYFNVMSKVSRHQLELGPNLVNSKIYMEFVKYYSQLTEDSIHLKLKLELLEKRYKYLVKRIKEKSKVNIYKKVTDLKKLENIIRDIVKLEVKFAKDVLETLRF
jgi:hypothetical protein